MRLLSIVQFRMNTSQTRFLLRSPNVSPGKMEMCDYTLKANLFFFLLFVCTLSLFVNLRQRDIITFYANELDQHSLYDSKHIEDCGTETLSQRFELDTFDGDIHPENNERPCDLECELVQEEIANWPAAKTLGAIYYLVKSSRVKKLTKSLEALHANFNQQYDYPVIIFHENDLRKELETLRTSTKNRVYFQEIKFEEPAFLQKEIPEDITCKSAISYRHMARFHAKVVYEYPIVRYFDYLFRLDDDSVITSRVEFDLFQHMAVHQLQYGYRLIHFDLDVCVAGLWEVTDCYAKENAIKPEFYHNWTKGKIYYNNFEISKTSFWLSKAYQDYIQYIDRSGGIFYHRWGDAPVKSLALSLFMPPKSIHCYGNVGYQHGRPNSTVNRKLLNINAPSVLN